jgi:hypothetical protein
LFEEFGVKHDWLSVTANILSSWCDDALTPGGGGARRSRPRCPIRSVPQVVSEAKWGQSPDASMVNPDGPLQSAAHCV